MKKEQLGNKGLIYYISTIVIVIGAAADLTTGCGQTKTKAEMGDNQPGKEIGQKQENEKGGINKTSGLKEQTTPVEKQEAKGDMEPQIPGRGWQERVLYYPNGTVEHNVIYMSDPYEKYRREDEKFRTYDIESVESMVLSPVILVGKVICWPISALGNPPYQIQYSRGDLPVEEPKFYTGVSKPVYGKQQDKE